MTAKKWLRWLNRGIGTLATAVCPLIVVSEVVWLYNPAPSETPQRGWVLVGLTIVTVLAALAALRWKLIGGVVIIAGAAVLIVVVYATVQENKLITAIASSGRLLLAGILFLMSWWGSKEGVSR